MTSTSALDRFCSEYHSFNNITEDRARSQRSVLREFEVLSGVSIEQTDDTHFRAYLAHRIAQGDNPNTVRKKGNMIRPFFGWAFDARLVSADTLMRVQRVKNPRGATSESLPNPYDRKEIQRLWVDLDRKYPVDEKFLARWQRGLPTRYYRVWTTLAHAQTDAIIHLALHAGMRRSEIYNAEIDEIHYDNEYVVVGAPARKNPNAEARVREVPMTEDAEASLRRWFDLRAFIAPDHDRPWLSLSPWARPGPFIPMPEETFGELLGGIGRGYELHRLRHTCATEWLRGGVPIDKVQKLLGHARIQQTLAYAKILPGDLADYMKRSASNFQTAVRRQAA